MSTLIRTKSAPVEPSLPNLRSEMNRLIQDAFNATTGWSPLTWARPEALAAPVLDVVETPDAYLVMAELPGMRPEDVEVQLEGTALTVRGTKGVPSVENGQLLRQERSYGSFCRTIVLPGSIDADTIEAAHEQGVLTVRVPKPAEARPRRIEVRTAG